MCRQIIHVADWGEAHTLDQRATYLARETAVAASRLELLAIRGKDLALDAGTREDFPSGVSRSSISRNSLSR